MWFLVLILIRAILEQSMVSKTSVGMSTTDTYLNLSQIYKTSDFEWSRWRLSWVGEDSLQYRKRKKHLAAAILPFNT